MWGITFEIHFGGNVVTSPWGPVTLYGGLWAGLGHKESAIDTRVWHKSSTNQVWCCRIREPWKGKLCEMFYVYVMAVYTFICIYIYIYPSVGIINNSIFTDFWHLLIVINISIFIDLWELLIYLTHLTLLMPYGTKSMASCKKDLNPLLTHWGYVFLALTHQNVHFSSNQLLYSYTNPCSTSRSNTVMIVIYPTASAHKRVLMCPPYKIISYLQYGTLRFVSFHLTLLHPLHSPWHHTTSNRWLSARLQYLQCVSTGDTAVLL